MLSPVNIITGLAISVKGISPKLYEYASPGASASINLTVAPDKINVTRSLASITETLMSLIVRDVILRTVIVYLSGPVHEIEAERRLSLSGVDENTTLLSVLYQNRRVSLSATNGRQKSGIS